MARWIPKRGQWTRDENRDRTCTDCRAAITRGSLFVMQPLKRYSYRRLCEKCSMAYEVEEALRG